MSNTAAQKIEALASAIINLITTHSNITGSSQEKGHVQAGGAPQSIGTSLSAGTDNGFYARADHVHTVSTDNITDSNTYSNLGVISQSSQQSINQAIDSIIGDAIDYINR